LKPIQILQSTEETPIIKKAKELCQTILDQPGYQQMKQAILGFLENEEAVRQYQDLCDQQDQISAKHQQGVEPTPAEMEAFEKLEHDFLQNPQAQGFISAQRQMHTIEQTVLKYVRKTFEIGKVPSEDDFGSCGCGSGGCGCH
jgi:cell fate (sporulation/competence/biofilm development) regulator YlbF (YheA/YmcA/DUF963 family)